MGNICNQDAKEELISKSLLNTYFQEDDSQPYAPIKPIISAKIDSEYSLQIGRYLDKSEIIDQEVCIQQWQGLLWNPEKMDTKNTSEFQKALYTIHKTQSTRFEEVLELAGGGQIRWFIWKTLLYSCIEKKHRAMKIRQTDRLSIVERDVKRTFPSHPFFQLESQSQQYLSQLLNLVGATFKGIGYTQGMNFILAFILMQSGGNFDETWAAAFLLFYCSKWMLYGIYLNQFPLMKLICILTKQVLKEQDEELYNHYIKLDIDDSFLLCKWIFTLYLYNIPLQACLHFWDTLILKGIFVMASINSTLLIEIRSQILKFRSATQFLEYAQDLQQNNPFKDYKKIKSNAIKFIPKTKMILQAITQLKPQFENNKIALDFLIFLENNFSSQNFEKKYQQWMGNNLQNNLQ